MSAFCRYKSVAVIYVIMLFMILVSSYSDASETIEYQKTLIVKPIPVKEIYEAMGTIRPLAESNIHSQISAKVIDVLVSAGDRVDEGELLIRLDDREVLSKLEQAKEGFAIAGRGVDQAIKIEEDLAAEFAQAESDYNRSGKLYKDGINSKKDFDQAKTRFLRMKSQLELLKERVASAKARLRQAEQEVKEAELFAEYANIRALNAGVITNRSIDPGDLATPAQPLLTIQTGLTLRLEAGVRESLIDRIKIGMSLGVRIGSKNEVLNGVVEEIEPYANAKTRSFLVKVTLPEASGVYPGMFGRLLIPLDTVDVVLVPIEAIISIGQLKYVNLISDKNGSRRIYVKTGKKHNDKIEVLSGLEEGDTIVY